MQPSDEVMVKGKEDFRILLVYPNLAMMLVPPIALAIFTRILKIQGYQVDLFDATHYATDETSSPQDRVKFLQYRKFSDEDDLGIHVKYDMLGDLRRKVQDYKPDLLLFSVVEDVFSQTIVMLETIKDLNIPHLLGGVFPTTAPDRCFEFSEVKMLGLGEGENTIVEVSEAVRLNLPLHNIPNVWYRDDSEYIHKNQEGSLVDINSFTPDYGLFDERRFMRPMGGRIFKAIPVETYRGCPFLCTYCNSPGKLTMAKEQNQGNFLRRKTMTNLRTELQELVDLYDPEFFFFIDDSFLARPEKEIYDFCDMYEEFKLPFWFNTRPETCDEEKLKQLKTVGCYRISYGLECGNEVFRQKVLLRHGSNEQVIKSFEPIINCGIPFTLNLVIGFPGETREMIMETVEMTRAIGGYDTLTVSTFTPYHGTALREVAIKNNWLDPNTHSKSLTSESVLRMLPPYVNAEDLNGLMRVLSLYCYFPKSEWGNIRRAEIDDKRGNELLKHYSGIYRNEFLGETQDKSKVAIVTGTAGCRSNEKDSFQVIPKQFTEEEIRMLTC
jgi:anaerobic magnesium-protoporphyrin IX monomethyl ester cyclase